jgi:Mg/Co/Ni transporter MgtE
MNDNTTTEEQLEEILGDRDLESSSSSITSNTPLVDDDEEEEIVGSQPHAIQIMNGDEYDDISPSEYLTTSVYSIFKHRIGWLIGLLLLQSFSSFILATFEKLLSEHIIITLFLTMLIGSGGNAGSQSTVIIVRGIATGEIPKSKIKEVLWKEFRVGLMLSLTLGFVGLMRVVLYRLIHPGNADLTRLAITDELLAITISLMAIILVSVVVGTALPLFLHFVLEIDSAHATPTLQVTMDIIGVLITCLVCQIIMPTSSSKVK